MIKKIILGMIFMFIFVPYQAWPDSASKNDPLQPSTAEKENTHTHEEELQKPKPYNQSILNCLKPLGHHVFLKEFECPLDGEKFESLSIGTHSIFGRYLDLKPVSYMDFPVPLPVCPSNGFVLTKKDYSPDELSKLSKIITSEKYKDIFTAQHSSFYLYAKINEEMHDPAIDQWWLLLNATWEAYGCQNQKKYKQYALETIEVVKETLKNLQHTDDNFWALNILVSELYRRIGDFENAQNWLDTMEKIPENKEYELLSYKLLQQAIVEKNIEPVEVKKPKK